MHLWEALQIQKGEVIAFVGAGGKTTAMYRLGRELADRGWRVVATTTTMIRPPSATQTEALIVHSDPAQAIRLAAEALCHASLVTLASERLKEENKLRGVNPALVASLAEVADAVIIEADGARGRSLKAPAAYEPVVPSETTLLVAVVGIDAVGRPLTEETVHRPELVAELAGIVYGDVVGTSVVANLLLHRQGALKDVPTHARVAPLINKVEDDIALAAARRVAVSIKGNAALARVLIGAVARADPISECWRRVSAVVLAAGASTRFGSPKQLLDVGGRTMIEHVLDAVRRTTVDEVVVVLGHEAEQIARRLPTWCRMALNEEWQAGISTSIQLGLDAIASDSEAVLFLLADQLQITSMEIDRILLAFYGSTKPIVVPVYGGQRGNPVLFDRRFFPLLRDLRGDIGGRQLVDRFPDQVLAVTMPSENVLFDVDTHGDYAEYLRKVRGTEGNT